MRVKLCVRSFVSLFPQFLYKTVQTEIQYGLIIRIYLEIDEKEFLRSSYTLSQYTV